jgi:hypothetical protein
MTLLEGLFDAKRRPGATADPTGTAGIRRSFRAHGELRLRRLRALTRQVMVDYDILGLGSLGAPAKFQAPSHRLQTFAAWFEAEAKNALAQDWHREWTTRAAKSGELAAARELADKDGNVWLGPMDQIEQLHQLAEVELRGIAAALTQKTTRIAHTAVLRGTRPVTAYRAMVRPFDKVASVRLAAFANTMTIKAHNIAKLITYKANDIGQVGVTPELGSKLNLARRLKSTDFDPGEARDPGGKWTAGSSAAGATGTAAFKRWFGASKVVDQQGKPLVVYHGTTNEFTSFDPQHANIESNWGAGIYFTSEVDDLENNYSTIKGPDLTSRIERLAERISSEKNSQQHA